MAREYFGIHSMRSLIALIRGKLDLKADITEMTKKADKTQVAADIETAVSTKVNTTDIVNSLDSTDVNKPLSAAQGKALSDRIDGLGVGDMTKSTYDKDDDGVIDKAKTADTATNATNAVNAETALKATEADLAANATKLGGVEAANYVQTDAMATAIGTAKTEAVTSAVSEVGKLLNKPNGYAGLNADGQIPSENLPSYVDDVIDGYFYNGAFYTDVTKDDDGIITSADEANKITGESSKIYVDVDTSSSYRWSGTVYVPITSSDLVEITAEEVQEIWEQASSTEPSTP